MARVSAPMRVVFAVAAAVTVLIGVLAVTGEGSVNPSQDRAALTQPLSVASAPAQTHEWLTYARAATYDSVKSDVRVPLRDGKALSCVRYQPGRDGEADGARHPGIFLNFTPYGKENPGSMINKAPYYAERGYEVLACDVRGSGDSDGIYQTWFQPQETRDNYDAIEWMADQPTSTGKIAQTGESYGSITAYRVAALRPPHLVTIIPANSPTNIYADWVYPGGIPSSSNMTVWAQLPLITDQAQVNVLKGFRDHPLYDDFWKQIATTNKLDDISIPVLHLGGYFDIFKSGGFDALAQRPDRTWLLYGPWTHVHPDEVPGEPAPRNPNAISTGVLLQWLDRWLMNLDDAKLPPSRVTSFESNSSGDNGAWKAYDTWPPEDASNQRVYPTANGGLSRTTPQAAESAYAANGADGPSVTSLGTLPTDPSQDQSLSDQYLSNGRGRTTRKRLTFTLPPFERNTVVTGPVTMHLRATVTTPDAYLVSKLEVVAESGATLPVETGYLRAQLRRGLEHEVPVIPGEPTDYTIGLGDTHWRFMSGERLRVTLSSGDAPKLDQDGPAGIVTLLHGEHTYIDYTTTPS
ncbi:CocE/NonD family hydrolase [Solicola gregarius]|uniref:CocE/NonD family hydrolase n=1 Tax=Solicola gregarius TaxID=2908642 RepID=A0AA46YN22_9ACTN|nr:CocE/NonD family hydrolase [Solicola gregarius]UYM06298.1 CocE/NonD family hydrolase [Solicola gregarius]